MLLWRKLRRLRFQVLKFDNLALCFVVRLKFFGQAKIVPFFCLTSFFFAALIDLAIQSNSSGDEELKIGQTKMKSVMVYFLVRAGIRYIRSFDCYKHF